MSAIERKGVGETTNVRIFHVFYMTILAKPRSYGVAPL